MYKLLLGLFVCLFVFQISFGKIVMRAKRQIERESVGDEKWTGVITPDESSEETTTDGSKDKTTPEEEVMEIDFDPKQKTFGFGGRFPVFMGRNFNEGFENIFRRMNQHFEEMTRNMFQRFNTTSIQYPPNYNGTKEEIIEVDGKKYLKKEHVVKKSDNNINIFLTSTTYEEIKDEKNES